VSRPASPEKVGDKGLKSRGKVSTETAKEYARRLGGSVSVPFSRTGGGEMRGKEERKKKKGKGKEHPKMAEHTSERRRTGLNWCGQKRLA